MLPRQLLVPAEDDESICAAGRLPHIIAPDHGSGGKGQDAERARDSEFTVAISRCGKQHLWAQALSLLEELRAQHGEPSASSCSAVCTACTKAHQWIRALALMAELCNSGVQHNLVTHSTLISALARGHKWKQALCQIAAMQQQTLHPNLLTFTAAISASSKALAWRCAASLLFEMRLFLFTA